VRARLVAAAVFKTVGRRVNRVAGGFDSHALPLSFVGICRASLAILAGFRGPPARLLPSTAMGRFSARDFGF